MGKGGYKFYIFSYKILPMTYSNLVNYTCTFVNKIKTLIFSFLPDASRFQVLTHPCVTKFKGVDSWIHVSQFKQHSCT